MNFLQVSSTLLKDFSEEDIHYAVIGGFALGFWGVTRATIDMDFLLLLSDADAADGILRRYQYEQTYKSENVARYESSIESYGTIDIIFAFRDVSKNMLARSVLVDLDEGLKVRSLLPEDIIGLKIQAMANDPTRKPRDLNDIRSLLSVRLAEGDGTDWDSLKEYCLLFDMHELYESLKDEFSDAQ